MLVVCKYADLPGCTNACEHSTEHEAVDFDGGLMCDEHTESCDEVEKEHCICIPTSEFFLRWQERTIKTKAKQEAKSLLKGFEEI